MMNRKEECQMSKIKAVFIYSIPIFVFFVLGGGTLFMSIRDVLKIRTIVNSPDTKDAVIITVNNLRGSEMPVYFKIANDEKKYRTHLTKGISKNIIKEGQMVHVKGDENGKLYIIYEYLKETYATYIGRIIVSVFILIIAVYLLIKTIEFCIEY